MNKLPDIIQFSNIKTKLKFQAQINNAKKEVGINSITFYYQMSLPVKIHLENPNEPMCDTMDRFEKTILGELYGGVILEKYSSEEHMKCYLIHDGRRYKIGQSKNPEKRVNELKTANPTCKLVSYSELISEKFLHEVFAHRNVGREWFNLIDSDVEIITKMMKITNKISAECIMRMCARQIRRNKPNQAEMRYTNVIKAKRKEIKEYDKAKFTFGKYKGILVKDMMSAEQRNYLFWAYHNLGNLDSKLKAAIKIQIGI